MFPNLFRLCGASSRRPATRKRHQLTTDIFLPEVVNDNDLQVNEACLTEDNKFVGCTAKFNAEWGILPLRPDLCPKEYVPFHSFR